MESAFDFGGGGGGAGGLEGAAPGLAPGVLEAGIWSESSSWSEPGTPRTEPGAGDAWSTPRGGMLPVHEAAGDGETAALDSPDCQGLSPDALASDSGTLYESTPEVSDSGTQYESTPEPSEAGSVDGSVYGGDSVADLPAGEESLEEGSLLEDIRGSTGVIAEYSDSFCSTPSLSTTPEASPRHSKSISASPRSNGRWKPVGRGFALPSGGLPSPRGAAVSPRGLVCPETDSAGEDAERYSSDSFCSAPSEIFSHAGTPAGPSPRPSPVASPLRLSPRQAAVTMSPAESPRPVGPWTGAGPTEATDRRPPSLLAPKASGPLTLERIRGAKAKFLQTHQAVSSAPLNYSALVAQLQNFPDPTCERDEEEGGQERIYPVALIDRLRIYNLLDRMRKACAEIDELEVRRLPEGMQDTLFYRNKLRVLAGKEATMHLRAQGVI